MDDVIFSELSKVIAISGSLLTNELKGELRQRAILACEEIGSELAKAGWKIAVYTSDPDFAEIHVIKGYLKSGKAKEKSIICYFPHGIQMKFYDNHPENEQYFIENIDQSSDWQVSFYHSLTKVDAVFLLGGGATTFTTGQIALSRRIGICAVAGFEGAAKQIWLNLKPEEINILNDEDIQVMAQWHTDSASKCVTSLDNQFQRLQNGRQKENDKLRLLNEKATKWEKHEEKTKADKFDFIVALIFLILFILFLIAGLVYNEPGFVYPIVTLIGVCLSGGLGATIRMLTPNKTESKKQAVPILGIVVGLIFCLLYLLPQLMQGTGFLIRQTKIISTNIRVQFIAAIVVSFLAGLGFDYSIEQLLKKARHEAEDIIEKKQKII